VIILGSNARRKKKYYLAASAQELLLDNQGSRSYDPRLVQILDYDNVVHGLGPQHRRKRLLETGLGDLAHNSQACQAIVESWKYRLVVFFLVMFC